MTGRIFENTFFSLKRIHWCTFIFLLFALHFSNECLAGTLPDSTSFSVNDSFPVLARAMQKGANDSIRYRANKLFQEKLRIRLLEPGSDKITFDDIANVSVVSDPKGTFRIFTWVIPEYNGEHYSYYGFIQRSETEKGTIELIELHDSTQRILKPTAERLNADRWLGAIYYSIIPVKKSGKLIYTLIGWKASNTSYTEKILETFYFDDGKAQFGYPLFKPGSTFRNRIIYRFGAHVNMTLRYEESKKLIVMDHLNSSSKQGENLPPSQIGPDGRYDAFKYKSGHWILLNDIDIKTNWKPKKVDPVEPKPPAKDE